MIKTISKISFGKLSNALHVSYMNTIVAIINEHGTERMGMKEGLFESFTKAVSEEQLIVSRTRASEYTKELEANDIKRDNYFRAVIYKLRALLYETHTTGGLTSDVLKTIETRLLNVYPISIISDAAQVESAKIAGFVADIDRYIKEYVEEIGIKQDVAELDKANKLFEQAYIGRLGERAQDVKADDCRQKCEAIYMQCVYYIGGRANEFIDDSVDESAQLQISECSLCLDQINQAVKEFKWKYSTSSPDVDPEEDNANDNALLEHEPNGE